MSTSLDTVTGLVVVVDDDQAEPMSPLPSLEEVREYIAVPAALLDDDELGRMYLAAINTQDLRCRFPVGVVEVIDDAGTPTEVPTRPSTLVQALLRRVQRAVATKGLPLGVIDSAGSEYGPATVPRYDAMIEADEGVYRRVVFG